MTTILAIHAHPDDVEILAGGSVSALAAAGHSVVICTMTAGDCGSRDLPPEEIAEIRRGEAAEAAELIGAAYRCAEFRDLAIFNDDAGRRRVVELLRQVRPDLVITASPVDYMCDHEATSALLLDACFAAPAPNYHTGAMGAAPALDGIPHLYFCDPLGGVDRDNRTVKPDFFADVTARFAAKKEMLMRHRSQREWLLKHHGIDDYINMMEGWTRERGKQAGVDYAEGFRRYKGHPYPQSPLLEELLQQSGVPVIRNV